MILGDYVTGGTATERSYVRLCETLVCSVYHSAMVIQAYHSSIWETQVPSQILSQKKKKKEGETREMERRKRGKEMRKGMGRTGEVDKEGGEGGKARKVQGKEKREEKRWMEEEEGREGEVEGIRGEWALQGWEEAEHFHSQEKV